MWSSLAAAHPPDATQALGHEDFEVPQSLSVLLPAPSLLFGGEVWGAAVEGRRNNGEFRRRLSLIVSWLSVDHD